MMHRGVLVLLICVLSQSVSGQEPAPKSNPENPARIRITPIGDWAPTPLKRVFTKEIDIFGIKILSTSDTPDNKMRHAGTVLAEYLDNDEDGTPDNLNVVQAMRTNQATLVMFATQREAERRIADLERQGTDELDSMILQDLYGEETHPGGASRGIFDATLEEVLHLITHAGYASAYPNTFGEKPGTTLGDAMDKARGGRFTGVPRRYPKEAWYTYYDDTCDYGCQATEYIYWGLTSLLGGQDFPGRAQEIAEEWRLNTPEKFRVGDPLLYQLLSNKEYRMPTQLPDGRYRPNRRSSTTD